MHRFSHRTLGPVAVAAICAACIILLPVEPAVAQLTVQNLLTHSVSDATDEQYPEVADAITRFRNRDFDGAKTLLERAHAKNPKLPPPEVIMAQLYAAAGQVPAARAELERAVMKSPNDPDAYLYLSDLLSQDRQMTASEAVLTKAKPLIDAYNENLKRKRHFEIRFNIGMATVAELREQWDTAIKYMQDWLQLDPDSVTAHQRLGRVLFRNNNAREALKEFQAASKLEPKTINPEIALARLYEDSKDRDNATKFVVYAVRSNPKDLNVHLSAADWALATDQLNEAEKYADAALKIDPKSLEALALRARVARFKGDLAKAETLFDQAYEQAPTNFNVINQLALALADQDDPNKQKRALELAEKNVRNTASGNRIHPEAFATAGWVLYRLGRTSEAEKVLARLAQSGPLSPDSAFYVARMLFDRGEKQQAASILENALKTATPFVQRNAAQRLLTEIGTKPADAPLEAVPETTPPANPGADPLTPNPLAPIEGTPPASSP